MLTALLAGLVMISVLVAIHEFGHFIVAKAFGMGVPVFSIGMGPRLFGVEWGGTDYRVSALPIGGYVRLAGADPFGDEHPDESVPPDQDFMQKPVWQRLLVMLGGPVFNLVLPVVLFTGLMMMGEPQPDNRVGHVVPGSPAAAAGLLPGDQVLQIEGAEVQTWFEVLEVLVEHEGQGAVLGIARGEHQLQLSLPGEAIAAGPLRVADTERLGMRHSALSSRIGVDDFSSPAYRAGLRTGDAIIEVDGQPVRTWTALQAALTGPSHQVRYLRQAPPDDTPIPDRPMRERRGPAPVDVQEHEAVLVADPAWSPREGDPVVDRFGLVPVVMFIGGLVADSAAHEAGLQIDDRLLAIEGRPLLSWDDLIDNVAATVDEAAADARPRPVEVTLVREGEVTTLDLTPRIRREVGLEVRHRPLLGLVAYPESYQAGALVAKPYGFFEAVPRATRETWTLFGQIMGVLGSFVTGERRLQETFGGPVEIFRQAGLSFEEGVFFYARMMAHISLGLGIINLLPVPVLDGGQILFYSVEAVRGRPLSVAVREKLQMAGVLLLVALMLAVTVFDVNRWFTS